MAIKSIYCAKPYFVNYVTSRVKIDKMGGNLGSLGGFNCHYGRVSVNVH